MGSAFVIAQEVALRNDDVCETTISRVPCPRCGGDLFVNLQLLTVERHCQCALERNVCNLGANQSLVMSNPVPSLLRRLV